MSDFLEIRRYISLVIRSWWLIVVAVAVAAAIGFEVSRRQPPVYQASTTLIVGQSIQIANLERRDIEASQLVAQTFADIVRRQPVLQGAVERLGLDVTWQALRQRVRGHLVEGTQLLEIRVDASSPQEAEAIADEIAYQLILQSPAARLDSASATDLAFARQRLETLRANIEKGQAKLLDLETAMTAAPDFETQQGLKSEADALEHLIADWQTSYTQLLIFSDGRDVPNYLAVVEPAQAGAAPVRPQTLLNTLLASAVGLFLALVVIFLREQLDTTLKSAHELDQVLGLTALGAITLMRGKDYQGKLITLQEPSSLTSEAFRIIHSNIQFVSAERQVESILVTSPAPGEGKSIVAANLGVAMAQAGFKTIILDSDLRRPVQHQLFDVPNSEGLVDLLRSPELDISTCLRSTPVENLQLITSGAVSLNPSGRLSSQGVEQLLASLNEIADIVILDSPPALAVADAAVLSTQVDGAVLVIEAGKTHRDAARQAVLNLQRAGAHVLGAVLNGVSNAQAGYGYYYAHALTPRDDLERESPRGRLALLQHFRRKS